MKKLRMLLATVTLPLLMSGCAGTGSDPAAATPASPTPEETAMSSTSALPPLTYEGFRPIGDETIMMNPSKWGELNTHDPSIFKDGDMYYVFSTDASYGDVHKSGVQIRRSKDLVTWEYVGPAFENYAADAAEAIAYAKLDVSKNQGFWAPDVMKVGDTYRMYFSASTFGSTRSCIALAEADTVTGPYTFRGIVVESEANAVSFPNAIDPAMIYDENGRLFMSYGSFFGGIFMVELDEATGFIKEGADKPVRIAGSRGAAIEGSYLVHLQEPQMTAGWYYLFVSYGSLSSDYNIRVGRSRTVTGPYLDANGKDLATLGSGNEERVGTKLMGGYTFLTDPGVPASKGFMAPGHNSALIEGDRYFLVHHVRTYALPSYWFTMNIRPFFLNKYEWPVVAPHRYHGETPAPITLPDGVYALIAHGNDSNAQAHRSERFRFEGGVVSRVAETDVDTDATTEDAAGQAADTQPDAQPDAVHLAESGAYEIYEDFRMRLTLDGTVYDGVALKQHDWERSRDVYAFTLMSENGACVWGSTQVE
jgi:arabinan endo-1,5-alpha-L-arabinosidase